MRTTNPNITKLSLLEVFVFGSNESGIHGAGAAKQALKFGAKMGVGIGANGNTYAIPTKDKNIETLPLSKIKVYVAEFIEHTELYPEYKFLVTQIGCGLAGYTPENIAPLFLKAITKENIYLPIEFWNILK